REIKSGTWVPLPLREAQLMIVQGRARSSDKVTDRALRKMYKGKKPPSPSGPRAASATSSTASCTARTPSCWRSSAPAGRNGFLRESRRRLWPSPAACSAASRFRQNSTAGFGTAISWFEDLAFLVGSGVGQPEGILNSGATIAVTRGTANSVVFADVAGMLAKLPPGSLSRCVWVSHPSTLPKLLQLLDGAAR